MAETKSQSALDEFREFKRERRACIEAEDAGDIETTRAFRAKWFGRYPRFVGRRSSMFENTNNLMDYLKRKAEETDAVAAP